MKLLSKRKGFNPGKIITNDQAAIAATGSKTKPNLSLFLKNLATILIFANSLYFCCANLTIKAMTWTELWTAIGDFFTWMFQMMNPTTGNYLINYPLWTLITILVFSRFYIIHKQTKKAKSEGTLP